MTKKLLCFLLFTCLSATYTLAQQATINWVNNNALSIDSNAKYLPFLANQLKGNTILGLAEASHGTHEFSTEKARIINYLITHAGYRSIGFEFGYSPMEKINNYLLTGKGDLKKLMEPMRLFKTQEIYDLFRAIKVYNDGQPVKNKVSLFGFDTDYFKADIDSSARYCVNYLTSHPQQYKNTKAAIAVLKRISATDFGNLYEMSEDETSTLSDLLDEAKKAATATNEDSELRKRVSLLYQGTLLGNPLARDEFMAENIANQQQQTKAKTIIWSHNIHVAKDTTMAQCKGMGYYVKQKYHNAYYTIGFDTFKGSVHVLDDDTFVKHLFEGKPGSLSATFAAAKLPHFFIPFGNTTADPLYNIAGNITNIYANWGNRLTLPMRPGVDFDGLIFIRETTASIILE
ncbi:erythromycin esterase family protein [Inquilinus sp. KBS0705]|nr:erythromycin esterase family protein [Inquilinus sp. KBS0705]